MREFNDYEGNYSNKLGRLRKIGMRSGKSKVGVGKTVRTGKATNKGEMMRRRFLDPAGSG